MVFKLRIVLDARYPGIIEEVSSAMTAVLPANTPRRVGKKGCVEVFSYSRSWPCLFPQHGPGRKHEREIVLTDWQRTIVGRQPQLLLRGLIHSDGCRFINTGRGGWRQPRYSFSNASQDIHGIFREVCDLLELRWTAAGTRTTYVSRKVDVARMDEFIGPKA